MHRGIAEDAFFHDAMEPKEHLQTQFIKNTSRKKNIPT